MIPLIALIIASYTVIRLLEIAINKESSLFIKISSYTSIVVTVLCIIEIMTSGTRMTTQF